MGNCVLSQELMGNDGMLIQWILLDGSNSAFGMPNMGSSTSLRPKGHHLLCLIQLQIMFCRAECFLSDAGSFSMVIYQATYYGYG